MAKLNMPQRNALPDNEFAGPERSFPIPDQSHAVQALRERKFAPNPAAIMAKVRKKFPQVGRSAMLGQMKG